MVPRPEGVSNTGQCLWAAVVRGRLSLCAQLLNQRWPQKGSISLTMKTATQTHPWYQLPWKGDMQILMTTMNMLSGLWWENVTCPGHLPTLILWALPQPSVSFLWGSWAWGVIHRVFAAMLLTPSMEGLWLHITISRLAHRNCLTNTCELLDSNCS